jgi:hypothetical protein
MTSEIVLVSGLPRSGTSLMMQMLDDGGVEVVTDNIRIADPDNPRGYYEFEKVKTIKRDTSWLPQTRGKAFKIISQLLYELPPTEKYQIIFMERDMDEMLVSQEKMLKRLGRDAVPREEMKRSYSLHLQKMREWLRRQRHMKVLYVSYNDLVEHPEKHAERVSEFLDGRANAGRMTETVDSTLYRNRKIRSECSGDSISEKAP